jgi:hypothetical protein
LKDFGIINAVSEPHALATVAATYRLATSIAAVPRGMRDFSMSVVERGLREKSRRRPLQTPIDPDWLEKRIQDIRAILQELALGDF